MKVNPHRSSLGMDANIMALLCYLAAFVLAWIPYIKYVAPLAPLVIFFIEKGSPFVKFHAIQAFALVVVNWVLMIIFEIIYVSMWRNALYSFGSSLGAIGIVSTLAVIIGIVLTIFAIIAMVKAYGYFEFKLPVVGNIADKLSKKNMPF
jgi:uncharacterized membrane protein